MRGMERFAVAPEEEVEVRNVGFLISGSQRSVTWEAGGSDSVWTLPLNCLVTLLRPSTLQVEGDFWPWKSRLSRSGLSILPASQRQSVGRKILFQLSDNTEELSPVPGLECVLSNGW